MLILFLAIGLGSGAGAQWQIGEQVFSPPAFGNYYSMLHGADWPPLPNLPYDVPVYYLGTIPGTTNLAFAYDDRLLSAAGQSNMQSTEGVPPVPGDDNGTGGGSETNAPMGTPFDYGTNLYLITGPLTNHQVWLVLTNTHNPTYYQLQSRPRVQSAPWALGEVVQDSGTTHQVSFSNVRTDDPSQKIWRGVGGSALAFIAVDPDYNLAVRPGLPGGPGQNGKFQVLIKTPGNLGLNSDLHAVYQVSGSASNGVDYSSLSGGVTITSGQTSAEIDVEPLYHSVPGFDESVTLTLVLTNGYVVDLKAATATLKIYDPRPSGMAVAIHDSGWTRRLGLSSTNWDYFVMPESVKEALRSDGTPYVVLSDLDIASGVLLTTNGTPKYPILISLAAEAIREDEIASLTNYVPLAGSCWPAHPVSHGAPTAGFAAISPLATRWALVAAPHPRTGTPTHTFSS